MPTNHKIINISITKDFIKTYDDFLVIVRKDNEFNNMLKEKKDGRLQTNKKNHLDSISIRFAITMYVRQNKDRIRDDARNAVLEKEASKKMKEEELAA
jgi:hypothetical protein